MKDVTQSRFASGLTIALGGWLMLSPIWISITGWALASVITVGAFLALMGIIQLFTDSNIPSILSALAAIYLLISAYVFSGISDAVVWNEAISAIVAFVLATWDGIEVSEVQKHHHAT